MVTFWLNGEETSSETESAVEQGGAGQDLTESNIYLTKQGQGQGGGQDLTESNFDKTR